MNETMSKIIDIMKEYIEEIPDNISENTKIRTELGVGSFEMVSIIGDIEDEFGISVDTDSIGDIVTLGDLVKYIECRTK